MLALSDQLCHWVNTSADNGALKWEMCIYADHAARDKYVSRWIVERGTWEPKYVSGMLTALRASSDRHPVLLDVGANIGFYTLAAARAGFRVHAFEPVPRNVDMLTASLQRNRLQHLVTLSTFAVASRTATLKMGVNYRNQGGVHHEPSKGTTSGIRLAALALDTVLSPADVPTFYLKMDVEESECGAVSGMQRLVNSSHIVGVKMELHKLTKECCVLTNWTHPGGFFHTLRTKHRLVPDTRADGALHQLRPEGCREPPFDLVWYPDTVH